MGELGFQVRVTLGIIDVIISGDQGLQLGCGGLACSAGIIEADPLHICKRIHKVDGRGPVDIILGDVDVLGGIQAVVIGELDA